MAQRSNQVATTQLLPIKAHSHGATATTTSSQNGLHGHYWRFSNDSENGNERKWKRSKKFWQTSEKFFAILECKRTVWVGLVIKFDKLISVRVLHNDTWFTQVEMTVFGMLYFRLSNFWCGCTCRSRSPFGGGGSGGRGGSSGDEEQVGYVSYTRTTTTTSHPDYIDNTDSTDTLVNIRSHTLPPHALRINKSHCKV